MSTPATPTQKPGRWLLQQAHPVRGALLLTLLAGWGGSLAFIAAAWLLARAIHAAFIEQVARDTLAAPLIGAALLLTLRGLLAWLRSESGFRAGAGVRQRLRTSLLDSLAQRDRQQRAALPAAALTSHWIEQVEALDGYYARYLPQMGLALLVPLSILVVVFPLNWASGVILLVTAPLIPLFMALVGMGAAALNRQNFRALARLGAYYQDRLRGLPSLRRLGLASAEAEGIAHAAEGFRQRTMAVLRIAFLSSAVLEFFASVAIAVLAVYLGMSYLGYLDFGHYGAPITLETGLFILLLAPEFYLPLRELGAYYHDRAAAVGAAEELMPLMNAPRRHGGHGVERVEGVQAVKLQGVSFSYAGASQTALDGIDLTLAPGERIAVVGASGAGKSTLLGLLLGQIQPEQGQLLLGELPLSELDPPSWHAQLGWLGQHPYLFHASLRDNLLLAAPGADDGALYAALAEAGLGQTIAALPQGLDTPLGEQGHGLSGGQLRRLALARALLKRPSLLLLDEPSAALDIDSEAELVAALSRLPATTGMLILTHRPAPLTLAERIVVLEGGRIVAQGQREELSDPDASITQALHREGLIHA